MASRTFLGLALLGTLVLAAAPSAHAAGRPLVTAITSYGPFFGDNADLAFRRARDAGARAIRVYTSWRFFAPKGSSPPPGFDPTNPADPNYNFTGLDNLVRRAQTYGLEPMLGLQDAPDWAEGPGTGSEGAVAPDPVALGRFAMAVARRYSGTFAGLPRVRYYGVWNEPNLKTYLDPQFDSRGNVVSVDRYRRMVNDVADSVKSVDPSNRVIAGTLAPVEYRGLAVGPLRFTRLLLCVSGGRRPVSTCRDRIRFDEYAINPYTTGDPFHAAHDGLSTELGDLPALRSVLAAGVRLGHVRSSGPVGYWVTEFSWDSNPPDPGGVPPSLLTRWTAGALYQAWRSGVSRFTWFQLEDDPFSESHFQGGLFRWCAGGLACARPKPNLAAFRWPFVAYRQPRQRVLAWGRTPAGRQAQVVVEQRQGRRWRGLARLRTDRYGIFLRTLTTRFGGALRARVGGDASPAYSLGRERDRYVLPFGSR